MEAQSYNAKGKRGCPTCDILGRREPDTTNHPQAWLRPEYVSHGWGMSGDWGKEGALPALALVVASVFRFVIESGR